MIETNATRMKIKMLDDDKTTASTSELIITDDLPEISNTPPPQQSISKSIFVPVVPKGVFTTESVCA